MGFLNPGKKRKKAADATTSKRSRTPTLAPGLPHAKVEAREPPPAPLSILERFPTEILIEIFIHTGVSALPLVCKSINNSLSGSHSLRVAMLQNFVFDLNSEVNTRDDKLRYALDASALEFKFVHSVVLEEVGFDTVLSLQSIRAECKNRLIMHYDRLNRRLLEAMHLMDADSDMINREITRMTDERITMNDVEVADLPTGAFRDFPKSWYCKFDSRHLAMMRLLSDRRMRFKDGDLAISNAIEAGCGLVILSAVLSWTEKGTVSSVQALISAFERDDLELVDWLLDHQAADLDLTRDDTLWIWIGQSKVNRYLEYLERKGATPSVTAIAMIGHGL